MNDPNLWQSLAGPADTEHGRLESWKEIAAYLGKDVSTVQRWEKGAGLPVYRHRQAKVLNVYAFRGELDGWRNSRRDTDTPAAGMTSAGERYVPRLIVLPFRMLRPDPDAEFLCFSLPDAITTSLSSLRSLVVRSPLAAGEFATEQPNLRALADRTQVDSVLLGTLLRDADTLQVNTQLVEVPTGTVIWSERSQVAWSDIFKLQEDLSTRIVTSLAVPLTSVEEAMGRRDVPATARAYELYLRARQLDHQANLTAEWTVARDMYLRSVEEDPDYAPAWARLGRIHRVIAKYASGSAAERDAGYTLAEQAFDRAFALNGRLDVAHNHYTGLELERGKSQSAMVRLIGRVRESGGTADLFAGLVSACRYCGLLDASMAAHEHAIRLDPLVPTSVMMTLAFMGRFDDVLAYRSWDVVTDLVKAECLIRLGRVTAALALLDQIDAQEKDFKLHSDYRRALAGRDVHDPRIAPHLRVSERMPDPEVHYVDAYGTASVGLHDTALRSLGRAVETGHFCYPAIAGDPWFDSLRTDPEFIRLMRLAESKYREALVAFSGAGGDRLLGTSS